MGYTTTFEGRFQISPPLTREQVTYLNLFASSRRMKRDEHKASTMPDLAREAVGLPVGPDGCYFVGGTGYAGQDKDASVLDSSRPPQGQPGLWCQWVPTEDGTALEWDENENFYEYVPWLCYIIVHFLKPWGRELNGSVTWKGEESVDFGRITATSNEVYVFRDIQVYGPSERVL